MIPALLLAILCLPQEENAAEIDEALARFKTDYKDPDVKKRAAAAGELGKIEHARILNVMSGMLTTDQAPVRVKAAQTLGTWKAKTAEAGRVLQAALKANTKEDAVTAAILDALGNLRDRSALSEVNARLDALKAEVSVAAIRAAGKLGSPQSLDRLIGMWERIINLRKPRVSLNSGSGMGQEVAQAEEAKRNAQEPAIHEAVNAITRQPFKSMEEARAWWNANHQTLKDQGPTER